MPSPLLRRTRLAALSFAIAITTAHAADAPKTPLGDVAPGWAKQIGHGAVVTAEKRDGRWTIAIAGTPIEGKDVGQDALFEIGSISKVFTGLLLADAVRDGKLALDDTLAERLPVTFASPAVGAITLQQLATHTSCLPRLPDNLGDAIDESDPYASYDDARLFAYLAAATLDKTAPCPADYSNLGIGTLGVVLEHSLGKPWHTLVADTITGPLGMHDTLQQLDPARTARFATPWHGDAKQAPWTFDAMAGAGALRSTAADMTRFADALLAGADGPFGSAWPIFLGPYDDAPMFGGKIGLAIGIADEGGEPRLTHNGGTAGFRSHLDVYPRSGRAALVLASNGDADPGAWLQAWRTSDTPKPAPPTPVALPAGALDAYAGVYALSPQARLTVLRVGDGLRVRLTGQTFLAIRPEAADLFFLEAVDAKLRFSRDAAGAIDAVTLLQNGLEQRATRSPDPAPTILFPDAAALAEYAADYDFGAFQPGATLSVKASGDVLTAQLTGQPALPIHNTAKDRFEWDVVPAALVFERDAQGRVVAAILHQGGAEMRSPRK